MNPNTGEILALANWPKFNPNKAGDAPSENWMNRAVSAIYEPGSTFKLITLAAAFDQSDYASRRSIRLREWRRLHLRPSHSRSQTIWAADGFGYSREIERRGRHQDCAAARRSEILRLHTRLWFWHADRRRVAVRKPRAGWRGSKTGSRFRSASISMGQEIGVTPMQLITAVSAIANGGLLYKPQIVAELRRGEKVLPPEELWRLLEPQARHSSGNCRDAATVDGRRGVARTARGLRLISMVGPRRAKRVRRKRSIHRPDAIRRPSSLRPSRDLRPSTTPR